MYKKGSEVSLDATYILLFVYQHILAIELFQLTHSYLTPTSPTPASTFACRAARKK
jgi:hypothetical protein